MAAGNAGNDLQQKIQGTIRKIKEKEAQRQEFRRRALAFAEKRAESGLTPTERTKIKATLTNLKTVDANMRGLFNLLGVYLRQLLQKNDKSGYIEEIKAIKGIKGIKAALVKREENRKKKDSAKSAAAGSTTRGGSRIPRMLIDESRQIKDAVRAGLTAGGSRCRSGGGSRKARRRNNRKRTHRRLKRSRTRRKRQSRKTRPRRRRNGETRRRRARRKIRRRRRGGAEKNAEEIANDARAARERARLDDQNRPVDPVVRALRHEQRQRANARADALRAAAAAAAQQRDNERANAAQRGGRTRRRAKRRSRRR